MKTYLRCLKYLKPYYKIIFISVICMVFYALFNLVSIALIEPIINKALLGKGPVTFDIPLFEFFYKDDALDAVYMMLKAAEGFVSIPQAQPNPNQTPMFGKKKKTVDWSGMKDG